MSIALASPPVGRPKSESRLITPDAVTRVPARISDAVHDALRELCLIRLKRPIEVVIGEWIEERAMRELKSAGIAVDAPAKDSKRK